MSEAPIDMSFERAFCARHGEPFRSSWPAGYPVALLALFSKLTKDVDFQKECEGNLGNLTELLDKRPMCCRLPTKVVKWAYLEAADASPDFGIVAKCDACGTEKLGTPYRTQISAAAHICFDCVLYRMQPIN